MDADRPALPELGHKHKPLSQDSIVRYVDGAHWSISRGCGVDGSKANWPRKFTAPMRWVSEESPLASDVFALSKQTSDRIGNVGRRPGSDGGDQ
jgi:hypothetical protein